MNPDILDILFEPGYTIVDDYAFSIIVSNATLRPEFRGSTFATHFDGCFDVDLTDMTLRVYDGVDQVVGEATIKISIDHTCTNPPTA